MAKMMVRKVDQKSSDPDLDIGLTKKGDVIDIREDTWVWSPIELANDQWTEIRVDGTVLDLNSYLAPEPVPEPFYPVKPRINYFDLDQLAEQLFGVGSQADDFTRKQIEDRFALVYSEKLPLNAALALQVTKNPTPAPGKF